MLILALAGLLVVSTSAALNGDAVRSRLAMGHARYALEQDPATQAETQKKPKKKKNAAKTELQSPHAEMQAEPDDLQRTSRDHFVWKKHPSFRYGSMFRLDVEAQFEEDARASYRGKDVVAGLAPFNLRRNRVGIQGNLFKHFEYEVKRELTVKPITDQELLAGKVPKNPWKDVFVNINYSKRLQLQAGKFKVPFGLDELTSVAHSDFAFRSLGANYLAPGRDVGGQVHGDLFKHGLKYSAGLFRRDGDNARSSKIAGANQTFAARVNGTPLRRLNMAALGALELGTAFSDSLLSNDSFAANGLRGRTVMTRDTFFRPVFVQGRRRRWEGDVDWTSGPVSARAEYTLVRDQRLQQGLGSGDLPDARYRSWYVSGTWILTGETKMRPLKPAHDFLQGGLGAVELAARYEHVRVDSVRAGSDVPLRSPRAENILPSGDRVLTLGTNWSLNRFIKLQFNAIREHVDDPERSPLNGAPFWSHVLRLQFGL